MYALGGTCVASSDVDYKYMKRIKLCIKLSQKNHKGLHASLYVDMHIKVHVHVHVPHRRVCM